MSIPLVGYVLKAALRDKLYLALLIAVVVGASLSVFVGSSAVIESRQFVVVFAAAGLRLVGVAGLILFVVFYIRRAFDARDVDFLLSRPVSRVQFIVSHAVAVSILAVLLAALVSGAVFFLAPDRGGIGSALWGVSLVCEFVIMACAALFFSMVVASATGSALAVMGLYVLGRMMGELLGIASKGLVFPGAEAAQRTMEIVSLIVPRLDLMAQTSWLVYGPGDSVGFVFFIIQTAAYTGLLVMAALVDLSRRQF